VIIIVLIVIIVGLVMLVVVILVVVVAVKHAKRTEAPKPAVVNSKEAVYDTIPDVAIGGVTEREMQRANIPDPPPIHSIHSQLRPLNPPVGLAEVVGEDVELTRNEAYGDILFKSNPADESRV
jgi:hypothetical protein